MYYTNRENSYFFNLQKILRLQTYQNNISGVLISPWPYLLPDVFCLMVRIFRFMLALLYIYK